jgi:hypothetical protein
MPLAAQFFWLLLLAIPVACLAWTVTHEEIFREPREFCQHQTRRARTLARRKFFYLFTCEYCFSHYIAIIFLFVTHFQMLYAGWRGYLVSLFALVWVANQYMSIYNRLRLDIKHEHVAIEATQIETRQKEQEEAKQEEAQEEKLQQQEREVDAPPPLPSRGFRHPRRA